MKYATVCLIVSGLFGVNCSYASLDSIGPNGINSSASNLTGAGVYIGQVELRRPGDPSFDTVASFFNSTVDPAGVFSRTFVNFQPSMDLASTISGHAVDVAGIMISTDPVATGVSPGASLFAVGSDPVAPGIENIYAQVAISANHLATLPNQDVKAVSLAFATLGGVTGVDGADGKSSLTSFFDWSATAHDILYVAAGEEPGATGIVPADNFNGITVGASDKIGNVYSRVGAVNLFNFDAANDRVLIDLIAPSRDVIVARQGDVNQSLGLAGGTSFAVPHVTGTSALLHEHANNQIAASAPRFAANSQRHEVIKAVLLNSADKLIDDGTVIVGGNTVPQGGLLGMERTVVKQDGTSTWLDSDAFDNFPDGTGEIFEGGAFALDVEMGAGHLNAKRALQQFVPGEYESDGAAVPPIGWDLGTTTGTGDIKKYPINQQLTGGEFISITLAWDREVNFDNEGATVGVYEFGDTFEEYAVDDPNADDVISDLDLFLVPSGSFSSSQAVALSVQADGTLEHIFFPIPTTGDYEIWVEQFDDDAGAQDFGLAWWSGVAPQLVVTADFDGNGVVDGADLAQWQSDFGSGNGSDADGDGDTDGADFLAWQRNFTGPGTLAAATTVPEPATWLLFAIGLLSAQRRSRPGCLASC